MGSISTLRIIGIVAIVLSIVFTIICISLALIADKNPVANGFAWFFLFLVFLCDFCIIMINSAEDAEKARELKEQSVLHSETKIDL